jgi:hypothetical protein
MHGWSGKSWPKMSVGTLRNPSKLYGFTTSKAPVLRVNNNNDNFSIDVLYFVPEKLKKSSGILLKLQGICKSSGFRTLTSHIFGNTPQNAGTGLHVLFNMGSASPCCVSEHDDISYN